MTVIRKSFDVESLRHNHDVFDPLLQVMGTLFAILLGFMVSNAMNRYDQATLSVEQEADAVGDVFQLSLGYSKPNPIARDCLSYTTIAAGEGWYDLRKRKMNVHVYRAYTQIWKDVLAYTPAEREQNIQQAMIEAMVRLGDASRVRAMQMSLQLPPVMWAVVLIGAMTTGGMVHFFGIRHIAWQIFTNSLVTIILLLNVFLLACYDDPFSGLIAIKATPFEVVRDTIKTVLSESPSESQ